MADVAVGNPSGGIFPTDDEYRDFLQGGSPESVVKDLTPAPGASGGAGGAAPLSSGTPMAETTSRSPSASVGPVGTPGTTGDLSERFGSIWEAEPTIAPKIEKLRGDFQTGAGTSATWGEAEPTLRAAGPQSDKDTQGKVKDYLDPNYYGPTSLDSTGSAEVQDSIDRLFNSSSAMTSGGGLYGMINAAVPGLTPGEARAEAGRYAQDVPFQEEAETRTGRYQGVKTGFQADQQAAIDYAKQRGQEEQALAGQARPLMKGRWEDEVLNPLDAQVKAANEQNAATIAAYDRAMASGNVGDLAGAPNVQFDPAAFDTPAQQTFKEGTAERERIMGLHPGAEALDFGGDTHGRMDLLGADELPGSPEDVALTEALVEGGFLPHEVNYQKPGVSIQTDAPGKYGTLLPAGGFGEDIVLPDAFTGGYVTPHNFEGQANRENMSTSEQEEWNNWFADLLGSADTLARNGQTFEAAYVAGDVDKFLADEEAAIAAQEGKLSGAQEDYKKMLRRARRDYKKRERAAEWGKVTRVVMDVASLGTHEGARAIPGADVLETSGGSLGAKTFG